MKNSTKNTLIEIVVLLMFVLLICGLAYNQYGFKQKTFTIIDSEGITYQNLHRTNKGWYVYSEGRLLEFHGNYRVIEEKAEK